LIGFWELPLRGEEEVMAIEDTMKNGRHVETERGDDALDLLEREDVGLRRLFAAIEEARADTVRGRAAYGDVAKDVIQHLATREAALIEVARKIEGVGALGGVAPSFDAGSPTRRELLNRLEKMSRGVQGINLNTGQDFDGVLQRMIDTVGTQIERDLTDAIPAVRAWISRSDEDDPLKSADYVVRHAPTSLSPHGPRWYEGAPVVSRPLTIYDRVARLPTDGPTPLSHRRPQCGRGQGAEPSLSMIGSTNHSATKHPVVTLAKSPTVQLIPTNRRTIQTAEQTATATIASPTMACTLA